MAASNPTKNGPEIEETSKNESMPIAKPEAKNDTVNATDKDASLKNVENEIREGAAKPIKVLAKLVQADTMDVLGKEEAELSPKAVAEKDVIGDKDDLKRLKINRRLALGLHRPRTFGVKGVTGVISQYILEECCVKGCSKEEMRERDPGFAAGHFGPWSGWPAGKEKVFEYLDTKLGPKCMPGYEQEHREKNLCDSTWTASNHKTSNPKNCKIYKEKKLCDGDLYGSGWQTKWGKFKDFADLAGRTALVCPECGCYGPMKCGGENYSCSKANPCCDGLQCCPPVRLLQSGLSRDYKYQPNRCIKLILPFMECMSTE